MSVPRAEARLPQSSSGVPREGDARIVGHRDEGGDEDGCMAAREAAEMLTGGADGRGIGGGDLLGAEMEKQHTCS